MVYFSWLYSSWCLMWQYNKTKLQPGGNRLLRNNVFLVKKRMISPTPERPSDFLAWDNNVQELLCSPLRDAHREMAGGQAAAEPMGSSLSGLSWTLWVSLVCWTISEKEAEPKPHRQSLHCKMKEKGRERKSHSSRES